MYESFRCDSNVKGQQLASQLTRDLSEAPLATVDSLTQHTSPLTTFTRDNATMGVDITSNGLTFNDMGVDLHKDVVV